MGVSGAGGVGGYRSGCKGGLRDLGLFPRGSGGGCEGSGGFSGVIWGLGGVCGRLWGDRAALEVN